MSKLRSEGEHNGIDYTQQCVQSKQQQLFQLIALEQGKVNKLLYQPFQKHNEAKTIILAKKRLNESKVEKINKNAKQHSIRAELLVQATDCQETDDKK